MVNYVMYRYERGKNSFVKVKTPLIKFTGVFPKFRRAHGNGNGIVVFSFNGNFFI